MYREFYGLARDPFEVTPDPYFYYQTPRHNEAMAALHYGVHRRKGFVVVTGEVGTGKTLLVRGLLDALRRNRIEFAFVYNPMLSVPDFLAHVLTDLGLHYDHRPKGQVLSRLNNYLVARSLDGGTTALVVDEAQLLSWELFEEIRLLTNLETSQHKLLQIVLVGQPELDARLDSHELRQLKQRISLRCHLEPLKLEESQGYIRRRLELAGANSHATTVFSDEATVVVHKFSRGIPRLINTLCENSLISGYGRQAKHITPEIVLEVAVDLRLDQVRASPARDADNLRTRKKFGRHRPPMTEELNSAPGRRSAMPHSRQV
jgi:general secretion pathway protein A